MAFPPSQQICAQCHLRFGFHEVREIHKEEAFHPGCWQKKRREELRNLLTGHEIGVKIPTWVERR